MSPTRIISWNVNGLRACAKKGFGKWLGRSGAEIVGVQEVRALPEQVPKELLEKPGWHHHFHPAQKLGYSGVGLFARRAPEKVEMLDSQGQGRGKVGASIND